MRKQEEKPIICCFMYLLVVGKKSPKLSQENREENLICNKPKTEGHGHEKYSGIY